MAVKYKLLKDVYHHPLDDRLYPAGRIDELKGWKKAAIQAALAAGLIEEVDDGQDRGPEL